jgi:hypothetical protein
MFKFNDGVEIDVYKTLLRNKEHTNCSLIIKSSYKTAYNYALYCADHDFFLRWVSYDDFDSYAKLGIKKVEYPDNDNYFGAVLIPDNNWAFSGYTPSGLSKEKTIKVTNFKTGKKTDIWVVFKDNPFRDPSMAEYWDFVAKTQHSHS